MASLAWISVFLVLQGGHSYILLTANLDDVQAIVREMAASPVAGQLSSILRRASNIFNQQLRANNAENQKRSFRRQIQTDSSFESQDNLIERQNSLDKKNYRHQKSSRDNDDQTHHNFRRFNDSPDHVNENPEKKEKTNSEEHESHRDYVKENKEENQENVPSKELEGKLRISKSKERDEDDIKVERHEKRTVARVNTDEVVALGKNASLYLNSIKKIIETI